MKTNDDSLSPRINVGNLRKPTKTITYPMRGEVYINISRPGGIFIF